MAGNCTRGGTGPHPIARGRARQFIRSRLAAPLAAAVTGAFAINRAPITNNQHAAFVRATGHAAPDVDAAMWASYGLIHSYRRTRRHAWRDGAPPPGRGDHPVVLVSWDDAGAYAA